jgi:hypothetical protein
MQHPAWRSFDGVIRSTLTDHKKATVMKDPDLWNRLRDYDFPLSGGYKNLTERVSLETALSRHKATVAVQEYRRFHYLLATGTQTYAPSPVVDAVWYEHLQDTHAYDDDFCRTVLQREIRPNPGRAEPEKDPAYLGTLTAYKAEFDAVPFHRVWPSPKQLRWSRYPFRLFIGAFMYSFLAGNAGLFDAFPFMAFGVPLMFVLAIIGLIFQGLFGPWATEIDFSTGG